MAQNLTEDLNIVANSNLEIELLDGDLNIIQKLDDEPNDVGGMTSAELKATFDKSGNIIKRYINETLIPAILEDDATDAARAAAEAQREANETQRIENENARIAAEQARVSETTGIVAQATEQAEAAEESARQAAQAILGQIVDGSLTEEKLEAEVQATINRAKSGGEIDTLLAGKAPAGYGIGEEYDTPVKDTDLDTLKKGGTYYIGTGCTNLPPNTDEAWSTLHVIPGRACTQIFIPANNASVAGTFSSWIARIYNNATAAWGEWEWINPPMAAGVEYRTTERYHGKSVYCKLVDFGKLPNNTYKDVAHGISKLQYAISVSGESNGDNLIGNAYITYVNIGSTNIRIKTNADRSGVGATVLIKYTKTTD